MPGVFDTHEKEKKITNKILFLAYCSGITEL